MQEKRSKNNLDLLWQLVKTNFKMRYQNSILGFLWVLIKPYAMFAVMYLIFSNIIRSSVENYPLYLLTGVIFISFLNELLVLGQMSLLERANIILKVSFPRYIAIISALLGAVINLVINLLLIIILVIIAQIPFNIIDLGYLLTVISVVFIWGLGMAFFLSILTVRFRDLKNIVELFMFVMQYATPVFYALSDGFIPENITRIIGLNPLAAFMNQFRSALNIYGERDYILTFVALILGIVFSYVGYLYFKQKVKQIAEFF